MTSPQYNPHNNTYPSQQGDNPNYSPTAQPPVPRPMGNPMQMPQAYPMYAPEANYGNTMPQQAPQPMPTQGATPRYTQQPQQLQQPQHVPTQYATQHYPPQQYAHPQHYPQPQFPYPAPTAPLDPTREYDEITTQGYTEHPYTHPAVAHSQRTRARIVVFAFAPLFLISQILVGMFLPQESPVSLVFSAVFFSEILVMLVCVPLLAPSFPRRSWRDVLALRKPKLSHIFLGIGAGIGVFLTSTTLSAIISALGIPLESSETSKELFSQTGVEQIFLTLIAAPILAPIFEEFLFRGIFMGAVMRAWPGKKAAIAAIVSSGLLFGLAHFQGMSTFTDFFVVIFISSMGIFLAWLRLKTNTIATTICAHATYNGILAALSYVAL